MEEAKDNRSKHGTNQQQKLGGSKFPVEKLFSGSFKMKTLISTIFNYGVDKFSNDFPKLTDHDGSGAISIVEKAPSTVPAFIIHQLSSGETIDRRWEAFRTAFHSRLRESASETQQAVSESSTKRIKKRTNVGV